MPSPIASRRESATFVVLESRPCEAPEHDADSPHDEVAHRERVLHHPVDEGEDDEAGAGEQSDEQLEIAS